MSRFIAFLRAINVGRGRTVKMHSLRTVFESLGFSSVATFIASGNVVFETTTKKSRTLERKIEKSLKEALGYEVRPFVRGAAELANIANYRFTELEKLVVGYQIRICAFGYRNHGICGEAEPLFCFVVFRTSEFFTTEPLLSSNQASNSSRYTRPLRNAGQPPRFAPRNL